MFDSKATSAMEQMFYGCSGLTDLSAVSLPLSRSPRCFASMFEYCSGLTAMPGWGCESMTTSLAGTYASMFANCASLAEATLVDLDQSGQAAFAQMFDFCEKLAKVTTNYTGTYSSTTHSNWLRMVSTTGEFVCPTGSDVSARGDSGIPANWTIAYAE